MATTSPSFLIHWAGDTNAAGQMVVPAADIAPGTKFLILEVRYDGDDGMKRWSPTDEPHSRAGLASSQYFQQIATAWHVRPGDTSALIDDSCVFEPDVSVDLGGLIGRAPISGVRGVSALLLVCA